MRADRLLATVREASDPGRPEIRAALAKLIALGPSVVPLVMAELARSEKKATLAFVDVLAQLADARNFPQYVKGRRKTLRTYSVSVDLRKHTPALWVTHEGPVCQEMVDILTTARHFPIVPPEAAGDLRPIDEIERRGALLNEYP